MIVAEPSTVVDRFMPEYRVWVDYAVGNLCTLIKSLSSPVYFSGTDNVQKNITVNFFANIILTVERVP